MEMLALSEKITAGIKKYRYALLVLLLGIGLMLIPTQKKKTAPPVTAPEIQEEPQDLQVDLQEILTQIQGAGKVRVLLSIAKGETTVYQENTDTAGGESGTSRISTVIITDSSRGQGGLIRHKDPPVYLGAVVVCQGADSPAVRLAIKDAVSSITGLGSDKISVLKMK